MSWEERGTGRVGTREEQSKLVGKKEQDELGGERNRVRGLGKRNRMSWVERGTE